MGLVVYTADGKHTLECVDPGSMKAAIESGEHKVGWLPTIDGGSVLGSAIIAIGPPGPPPNAEELAKQERNRAIAERNRQRREAGVGGDDDPLEE